ncbi:MAG: hypothetical protein GF331_25855 [Chitinivibrionales bacterium]|nr:hypothetical protein [Chitinivibrionales bacterium]
MAALYRFPPMVEEDCPNGLHLMWVPDHELPAMTIGIQFPRGKLLDPHGFEGVTELAVELLQKGTAQRPPEQFSELLESRGCSLFADTAEEHILIGCRFLSSYAFEAIPLFWEMIVSPGLDLRELKRVKKEMLTSLDAEMSEPAGLASKHFHAQLFGSDHPAGRSPSRKSVRALSIETVRTLLERIVHPQGATVVVAGDFDLDKARTAWHSLFAAWDPGRTPYVSAPLQAAPRSTGIAMRLVNKGDLTQASLVVGHVVPGEQCEYRHEIGLANYILGGGNFSSRLMGEVRSRLGKTYGISSQLGRLRTFGDLMIATSTMNEQVGDMLEIILRVYRQFVQDGVTDDEVAKARSFATGSLAFQLEGIGHVVEKLLWLRLYDRDKSYIERYPQTIAGIQTQAVNHAIREYFTTDALAVTVVGNRRLIEPQVKGLGAVEYVDYRAAMP